MAEEPGKKKDPKLPPPPGGGLPRHPSKLPSKPPPLPGKLSTGPAGRPPAPGAPAQSPASSGQQPLAAWGATPQSQGFPGPMPHAYPQMPAGPSEADMRIAELEKRLLEEREKVLMAKLKSKEETTVSTRVENSLRDIQDKLRRSRRDSESEDQRLKQETHIQELEKKLVGERETWMATLRTQLQSGDLRDKEVEAQVTSRINAMERRWLDEKVRWEELLRGKEGELHNARALLEKLKGADVECHKLLQERKFNEERIQHLTQAHGSLQAQAASAAEHDRAYFQAKAELETTREHLQMALEKANRDTEGMRLAFREREERLLADIEKLQGELKSLGPRLRVEHEFEVRRLKSEHEGELKKSRSQLEAAETGLQRLRAVASALERQVALLREQGEEAKKLKEELARVSERYKSEFLVLQRKWQDREAEIREEAEARFGKQLEAEQAKIKLQAQVELQNRVQQAQQKLQEEMERELSIRERGFQTKLEAELASRMRAVQHDTDALGRQAEDARRGGEVEQGERMKAVQAKAEATQRRAEEAVRRMQEEFNRALNEVEPLRKQLKKEEEQRTIVARQYAMERTDREKEKAAFVAKVREIHKSFEQAAAKAEAAEMASSAMSVDLKAAKQAKLAQELQVLRNSEELQALKAQCSELGPAVAALREEKARLQKEMKEQKERLEGQLRLERVRFEKESQEKLKKARDESRKLKRRTDLAQSLIMARMRALEVQLGHHSAS